MGRAERPVPPAETRRRAEAEAAAARKREVRRERRSGRATKGSQREERLRSWVERAEPRLPVRDEPPRLAVLHLGPTNSGKTHDALEALADRGDGVYAAPLRQLAHEAYERLSEMLPLGSVGLATGEETVNPGAPVVCATVEKAPQSGGLLVLDESHWVVDQDRGHHWTRMALGGDFDELRLIAAPEAEEVLTPLVDDATELRVVQHRRLSRLDLVSEPVRPRDVPARTLVVTFSRRNVYHVARILDRYRPGRVGVLYGALPPSTRREVIRRFVQGQMDVLVTTDVIGHGINVPAETVLLAETEKFDGTAIRSLHTWEAAQIVGRAGRYGLSDHGAAGTLTGIRYLKPSRRLLQRAVDVARGDLESDLPRRRPRIRPELDDLGEPGLDRLADAIGTWQAWAQREAPQHGVRADDLQTLLERLEALQPSLQGRRRAAATTEAVWRLLNLPVDYSPPEELTWLELSVAALRHLAGQHVHPDVVLPEIPVDGTLAELERAALRARHGAALLKQFPGVAGLSTAQAARVEEECARLITERLLDEVGRE